MGMSYATLRIHPGWRCICGRTLRAYDAELELDRLRLICQACHTELLAIEHGSDTPAGDSHGFGS
jgi:hypothetical protein